MPDLDCVVRGRRVVTPRGTVPAWLGIAGGRIAGVGPFEDPPGGMPRVEAGDAVVLPGLVDSHVHVNEPGRTAWEGFASATRAAAAGGVTTLVDMPLNSVPATTTAAGLEAKRAAAAGRCAVDVAFWGGVVPENCLPDGESAETPGELEALWAAGVRGFKAFLVDSGVEEFPAVGEEHLRRCLPRLARLGAPLLAHAEAPGPIAAATAALEADPGTDPRRYADYLASRPPAAEEEAIALLLDLARESGARVHAVHLATASALPALAAAKAEGLAVTVETCPHYLSFSAEEVPDGATAFKCAPPIREAAHREALWQALGSGLIDLVASDHSPCPPDLKRLDSGDFFEAWGGIASLQLGLAAVWTECRSRGFRLEHLARWMAEAPARLAGLGHRKGRLAVGYDADLVLWHPEEESTVEAASLHHRHPLTPYAGRRLFGRVEATYLAGRKVYDREMGFGPPSGRLL